MSLATSNGTTLICLAMDDGVFLAADDLVYTELDGKATPSGRSFTKVCVFGDVLIGTAGLMVDSALKYDVQSWITDFIESHGRTASKLPSAISQAIWDQLRHTFEPTEPLVKQGYWESHRPGDRILSYIVAGYTESFKQAYVFETGVEINRQGDGLTYVSPLHHKKQLPHNVYFGEDYFLERASKGLEPERSHFLKTVEDIGPTIKQLLPDIPGTLQEGLAGAVSLIKVEAHFNPDKVGSTVKVALINRRNRKSYLSTF